MTLENELRHELLGVLVPYDAARADEMTRVAMQAALLDARRRWHAPVLAAAAVLVAGGSAVLAADRGAGGGTTPGGGPSTTPTSTLTPSSGAVSCSRKDTVKPCLTKSHCPSAPRSSKKGTLALKPTDVITGVVQVDGSDKRICDYVVK